MISLGFKFVQNILKMIKDYLTIIFIALICAVSINTLSAQEKRVEKKVIVVEKTVDEDGTITEKRIVKEGDDADQYLEENEDILTWVEGNEEGEVITHKHNEQYKVIKIDDEGNKTVLEWDGQGDMPDDIKTILEKEDLDEENIHVRKKSKIKIKTKSNGDEEEIEVEVDGEDMPVDVLKLLEEHNIKIDQERDVEKPKAQLGVMIKEADLGVAVTEIVEETAAEEAGLKKGDVITKVDNITVKTPTELVNLISTYEPHDVVKIEVMRAGQNQVFKVKLKERKELFPIKTWDDVIKKEEDVDVEKRIIIERK